MLRLQVWVKPGSRKPGFTYDGTTLTLKVTPPPVDGQANEAARRMLAHILGVPLGNVRIERGARARYKVFTVRGVRSAGEVRSRLANRFPDSV